VSSAIVRRVVLFVSLAACGGGPGGSDDLERSCRMRVDSPSGCSDACLAALDAATTACSAELAAIGAHPDRSAFLTCSGACATARTCMPAGGGTSNLIDCACGASCVRAQSASFQDAYEAYAACAEPTVAAACY
jgi:hypothetical protein